MNTILILIGSIFVLNFILLNKYLNNKKRSEMIKEYTNYMAVLHFNLEKAYDIIHKDQILIYSIEATALNDGQFHKATTDFILLVKKLLGPRLLKEFIYLYGDYETFAFNLAEYFSTKYDKDEIRSSSVSNFMEDDTETKI